MNSSRLFLLFALVAVLIIAGCTIKEPKNFGCCKKADAKNGQCVLVNPDASIMNKGTNGCDIGTGFCNITAAEGSEDITVEVPICSEAEEVSCIQPECKVMACGPYKFRPSIGSPSLSDMKSGEDADGPSSYDAGPQGIWKMACGFEYLDSNLQNVFKNTKGTFINTFRFGVGPSFSEYDIAKFNLPLSDAACNVNPDGSVDRYMNYLVTPDYYADHLSPSAYNSKYSQYKNDPKTPYPWDPIQDIGKEACVQDNPTNEPFNLLPYGGKVGSYLFDKTDNKVDFRTNTMCDPFNLLECWNIYDEDKSLGFSYEITTSFYANALRFLYWEDIKNQKKAPFECDGGMDCLSSNCNKDVYSRGVCEKTNGESANCECTTKYDDKYGDITTRCLPVSKWKKEADAPEKPTYEYFMDNESLFNNKNLKFTVCEHHKYQGVALGATPSEWDVCNTYTKVTSSPYYSLTANIVFAGTDHVQNSGSIGYSNLDEEEFKKSALVTECNMVEGKDYTVIDNVTKYYFGNWPNGISEKSVLTGGVYPQDDSWKITSNGMTVGWESITYIYTNDYIYINSLGTCKETEDPIKKAPVAKSYGWCEPCTYATMAMQKVTETQYPYDYDFGKNINWFSTSETTITISDPSANIPYHEYFQEDYPESERTGGVSCDFSKPVSSGSLDFNFPDFFMCANGAEYLPSTKPDIMLIQERTAEYLKKGIIPVLDVSADSLWNDLKFDYSSANNNFDITWSTTTGGFFNTVTTPYLVNIKYLFGNNKGPIIAVVSKVSKSDFDNSFIAPLKRFNIAARAAAIKELCPKCLTAVYIDNPDAGSNSGAVLTFNSYDAQRQADKKTLGGIFDFDYSTESCNDAGTSCDKALLKYIDVVSYTFNAAETVGSKFCENPAALSFSSFSPTFTELANLSRTTLQLVGKPSLVQKFTFRQFCNYLGSGSVVSKKTEQDITARMLSYLFVNQVELTKAGLIGLIYNEENFKFNSEAEPELFISGDVGFSFSAYQYVGVADAGNLPNTCALEKSSHYLSESKPAFLIQKIYTLPAEIANCMEKSPVEKNNPAISTKCRNGEKCAVPDPLPFEKSESDYKCPTEVIPEPCKKCADKSGDFKCTFTYMDNSKKTIQGNAIPGQWSGLDSSYSDIIAGLGDAGEVCCLEDDAGANYTYIAKELSSSSKSPIIYSAIGDPNEDCGLVNPSLLNTLCGGPMIPGVKDYKVTCDVK